MNDDHAPILLFVYGTLKRGQSNHARLRGSRWVGDATTSLEFELVDCGPYPGLRRVADVPDAPGNGEPRDAVRGELFEIDPELIPSLDEYEQHPDLYVRSPITLSDGRVAIAYVMPPHIAAPFPRIPTGVWPGPTAP